MQLSRLVCLGLSHQTANVELRESVSTVFADLAAYPDLCELVVVSTCNRVELYAYLDAAVQDGRQTLLAMLAAAHEVNPRYLAEHVYFYAGDEVAEHLCRVAAGLESLVLGEPQILGQIRGAFEQAQERRLTGPILSLLFRIGIVAGKRARAETAISTNPASVSSVAIALAQRQLGNLNRQRVLVVGLGEMGRLTIKTLQSRGVFNIAAANRTLSKAQALAAQSGGRAYGLDALDQALIDADVVFTAASAPSPLIDLAQARAVQQARGGRPLLLVDLAVPRNVAPAVDNAPGIVRFDVDDLRATLDEALNARQREVPKVEAIVTQELALWQQQCKELTVKPALVDLRQKAENIRRHEVERTLRQLGDVDPELALRIDCLSQALVKKLLHEPTVRLKQKAASEHAAEYAATFREVFGLEGA